jgi:periplasmic protein TonB
MRNSNLLSDCLVDSDADAALRNKQRRRKALTISLAVESVLLAALLVWPLLSPSTMSARYAIDPIPPYAGGGHRGPQTASSRPHVIRDTSPGFVFRYPAIGESNRPAPESGSDDAPSIGHFYGDGSGFGPGNGSDLLGGSPNGPPPPRTPDPKPPVVTKPMFVSQGAQEAMLVRRVEPMYPSLARQIHLSGIVELRAIIAKDGSVINLEVVSGNPMLSRAAVDAVKQWRYRPTLLNNQPIEVQTFVTVKFVLE